MTFPRADPLFRRIAATQARAVRRGTATIRAARRELRLRYPEAELNRQHDVRIGGGSVELWFAYRDGRTEPAADGGPWWSSKGLARLVVDRRGRVTDTNLRCRLLLGLPARNPPRLALRDVVSPELHEDLCVASEWLWTRQEVGGAVTLRLPSGKRLKVDFWAQRHRTRQAYAVALRSFAERDVSDDLVALRGSSVGSMAPAIQRELFRGGRRRKLGPGERLTAAMTEESWVVLVTAGVVRLYVTVEGYEPTVLYGTSGSLLGTHALVAAEPLLVGLQSVTPSVVLQLSGRRVEQLTRSNAAFRRAVADDLQSQLQELLRSYASRSAANLEQRLAREIALISELQPDEDLLPVTEQQLADGVGSIRESVGRTIAGLRDKGLIATTRHGLLILDKKSLGMAARAERD